MEKPFIHITFQHANYRIITNGIRVLVQRWALSRETYVHVQYPGGKVCVMTREVRDLAIYCVFSNSRA